MAGNFEISIRSNLQEIQKSLGDFAYRQVPFAAAQALTALARQVQVAEQKALQTTLDRPTPFTVNSIGVRAARKDNLVAIVYVKDIAAGYLAPYEFGGLNKLNSRALLKPVNAKLNRYGNLPRNALASLKRRADVYVGPVKTKRGEVNGVWKRIKATKGKPAHLVLLIRFEDAHLATQHLDYRARAQAIVAANFNKEFGKALAKAMATAR